MIGYRFIVNNSDVYIMKLEAHVWRMRCALDYDTTDYTVLNILNTRTYEVVNEISGCGVEEIEITYKVGKRVQWPPNIKHGTYFMRSVYSVINYLEVAENMNLYYDWDKRIKRLHDQIFDRKNLNMEEERRECKKREVLSDRIQACLDYKETFDFS